MALTKPIKCILSLAHSIVLRWAQTQFKPMRPKSDSWKYKNLFTDETLSLKPPKSHGSSSSESKKQFRKKNKKETGQQKGFIC